MSLFYQIKQKHTKLLLLCSLGALFEYYDFAIFALLMTTLKVHFFNGGPEGLDIFKTFVLGYVARLFGGIFYSHQCDTKGRKNPFLNTLFTMAIPTIVIGCLPTMEQIGLAAPLLLLFCRIFQGMAMGGESPSAITIMYESCPEKQKNTATGIILACIVLGSCFGSFLIFLLKGLLTEDQFLSWGWRLPFILGGVLCLLGAYLRRQLQETPDFLKMQNSQEKLKFPFQTLLKKYPVRLLRYLLVAIPTASAFLYFVLIPGVFLETSFHLSLPHLASTTTVALLIAAASNALFGVVADRWNPRCMYLLGIFCLTLAMIASYFVFSIGNVFWIEMCLYLMAFLIGVPTASVFYLTLQAFPTAVRVSSLALILNISNGVIVGSLPWLISSVTSLNHWPAFATVLLTCFGFAGFFALLSSRKNSF